MVKKKITKFLAYKIENATLWNDDTTKAFLKTVTFDIYRS